MPDFTPLAPAGFKTELDTAFSGKVATTGDESIAGVKTFTSSPVVPTPTTDFQAATKAYVDDNAGGGGGALWGTSRIGLDALVAGEYYGTSLATGVSSSAVGIVRMRTWPFVVSSVSSFDRIAVEVTTAASGGLARLGLYNIEGGIPTSLVADFGEIDCGTTGVKEVVITLTSLAAGMYAFAHQHNDAALIYRGFNQFTTLQVGSTTTAASVYRANAWQTSSNATYGTFPATWPAAVPILLVAPNYMMRAS